MDLIYEQTACDTPKTKEYLKSRHTTTLRNSIQKYLEYVWLLHNIINILNLFFFFKPVSHIFTNMRMFPGK